MNPPKPLEPVPVPPPAGPPPPPAVRWRVHVSTGGHVGVWDSVAAVWVWGKRGTDPREVARHTRTADSLRDALNAGRLKPQPAAEKITWRPPP